MKPSRRILSAFLALMMLITMVSPAFAEGTAARTYAASLGRNNSTFTITFDGKEPQGVSDFVLDFPSVSAGSTLADYGIVAISDPTSETLGGFVGWRILGISADGNEMGVLVQGPLTSEELIDCTIPDADWPGIMFEAMFSSENHNGGQGGNQGGRVINIGNSRSSFTIVYADSTERVESNQVGFYGAKVGDTLRSAFRVMDITNLSSTDGGQFSGWSIIAVVDSRPVTIESNLSTEELLEYSYPEQYSLIVYEPMFGSDNGGSSGGPFQVGTQEGLDVMIGEEGCEIFVAVQRGDGSTASGTVNHYYDPGLIPKGVSLAELGVKSLVITSGAGEDRKLIGWAVTENTPGGPKDHEDFLAPEKLLTYEIPGNANFNILITPIWEDDSYITHGEVNFLLGKGYFNHPSGVKLEGVVGHGDRPRGSSVSETMLPGDPVADGDTFIGWRKLVRVDRYGEAGNFIGSSYDSSDEKIYLSSEIAQHTVPTTVGHHLMYVAIYESEKNDDVFDHFGMGGATGVSAAYRPANYFAGSGTIELIVRYTDGDVETMYPGYLCNFNVKKGVSVTDAFNGTEGTVASYAFNVHRDLYNFAGWNIFRITGSEIISVPEGTEFAPGEFCFDMGDDGSRPGNRLYEKITDFELIEGGVSHEEALSIPATGKWFAAPVWQRSETYDVEVPGANVGDKFVVSVQNDLQLPLNVTVTDKYSNVNSIKNKLVGDVEEWAYDRGKNAHVTVMEIKLMVQRDGYDTWDPVTQFPEEGILITLPYPEGKDKTNFNSVVAHLISSGEDAGKVELLTPTLTDDGIQVRVYSLSPFALGYEEAGASSGTTPATPSDSGAGRQNPSTGV